MFLLISTSYTQSLKLTGSIRDINTGLPLDGANITINDINSHATSDKSGYYEFDLPREGDYRLEVSFIGYKTTFKKVRINASLTTYDFYLEPKPLLINETVVKSSRAEFRKTPFAFSQLNSNDIELSLASRDVVNILESTPSVYVSMQGGGTGDLRLNMRGFGQTNIAVMVNGVPVNNPENGEVYWSNWAGISDVVDYIQVQRGLGANPYSVSAVGGVLNIVTYGVGKGKNFRKISAESGSDNFRKFTFSFADEIITDKLAITALVSKKTSNGYADQTWYDEFTYFISLGSVLENHSLELQMLGSPQSHGQRLTLLHINDWKSYGYKFNPDWGYLNGKPLNLRDNVFHKPSVNLNHNWQINDKIILSNVFYHTYGKGGGVVPPWVDFTRTKSGLIDFDSEWIKNTSTILPEIDPELNYTENALRFTVHKHYWSGLISNVKISLNNLTLTAGIDAHYYSAENYREVDNLLGGDYTLFSSDKNKEPFRKLYVGDRVDYNADSFVRQIGLFFQGEYEINRLTVYANISVSSTGYKRIDYFNYTKSDPGRETGWKDITGFTIKHGYNYNIDENSNLYLNAGYFSKAPLSENVYDYTNNTYEKIKNEKIFNFETGYGYKSDVLRVIANIYNTTWRDKAIRTDVQDLNTGQLFFYNISGADARHMGAELEVSFIPNEKLTVSGMLSRAINKWTSNVNAVVSPESNPVQQKRITSYVNDAYVGGFPMITAYLSLRYSTAVSSNSRIYFNPVYKFFGEHYSQYNPDQRTEPLDEGVNSWKLPDYSLFDIHFGYEITLIESIFNKASAGFHIFNIIGEKDYIIDAIDGANHKNNSAVVWFGRGRWWNLNLTFEF
ncbi:MAG: TonB-dependent receptor [Melioribacteraceae bacterium]|nr:TonB-dependent receptor [Melioribacteraceae bacterium]